MSSDIMRSPNHKVWAPQQLDQELVDEAQLSPRPIDDVVDDAVFLRLRGRHDEVTLHVTLDPLQRLARAGAHQLVRNLANPQNLSRMNVDIGSLSAQPAHRTLMDKDARIRP